jgi:ATP-dependent Clp protease ATP-binding subunit ClpB
MAELRRSFRSEFLSRIDEAILFNSLTPEEITSSVDLLLVDLNKRLVDRRVNVVLDKRAKEWATEKGYNPVFGARALISGEVGEDATITFRVKNDELVLTGAPVHT